MKQKEIFGEFHVRRLVKEEVSRALLLSLLQYYKTVFLRTLALTPLTDFVVISLIKEKKCHFYFSCVPPAKGRGAVVFFLWGGREA